jgi:hypothetical protein
MGTRVCRAAQLFVLLCLTSAAAGCGGQLPFSGQGETSHASTGDTSVIQTSQRFPAGAGVARNTRAPDPNAVAVSLRAITISQELDHDEVVFELTGSSIPGWVVQYVAAAAQKGTGDIISIPGQSILEVLMIATPGPFAAAEYSGPVVVANQESPQVNVVQYSAAQSGVTQAFIGLNGTQPAFSVTALTDPVRIVIDVAH